LIPQVTQYGLKQGDLTETGSQAAVREIPCGKRERNIRKILALNGWFALPSVAFI